MCPNRIIAALNLHGMITRHVSKYNTISIRRRVAGCGDAQAEEIGRPISVIYRIDRAVNLAIRAICSNIVVIAANAKLIIICGLTGEDVLRLFGPGEPPFHSPACAEALSVATVEIVQYTGRRERHYTAPLTFSTVRQTCSAPSRTIAVPFQRGLRRRFKAKRSTSRSVFVPMLFPKSARISASE